MVSVTSSMSTSEKLSDRKGKKKRKRREREKEWTSAIHSHMRRTINSKTPSFPADPAFICCPSTFSSSTVFHLSSSLFFIFLLLFLCIFFVLVFFFISLFCVSCVQKCCEYIFSSHLKVSGLTATPTDISTCQWISSCLTVTGNRSFSSSSSSQSFSSSQSSFSS